MEDREDDKRTNQGAVAGYAVIACLAFMVLLVTLAVRACDREHDATARRVQQQITRYGIQTGGGR